MLIFNKNGRIEMIIGVKNKKVIVKMIKIKFVMKLSF